jgi:drug/metabolite transporter (DMT)-like permease
MMIRMNSENNLAIACLLFSASLWGLIWYPLRLLNDAGLSGIWSSLVMYLAAAALTLPLLFKRQSSQKIDNKGALLGLAMAAGVTNVAFVVALIEGEIMRVMLLFYLSPLWTVLFGRWWLKEKLSSRAVLFFCIAMLGSVVMLWNPEVGKPWPRGLSDWLALLAGIAFSINNVLARKLSGHSMAVKTAVTWWGVVFVATVIIVIAQSPLPNVSAITWLGAGLLGWLGIVAMTVAVLYGLARMPVYRSSVIMLFELIVAAIAAWLLTDEAMTGQEWIGGGMILLAAYGVAMIKVPKEN